MNKQIRQGQSKPFKSAQSRPIRYSQGKHFYSHIVETSILTLELGDMELSKEERLHLLSLAEANIHTSIVELILSELPEEDKKIFLMHLSVNDHDKIWKHLREKILDIENKIKKVADEVTNELHRDIKEFKAKT